MPGQPVVVRPQTPGGVLFMGWTALRVQASHVVLRELRFGHVEDTALRLEGASHSRVTQCQFEQCGSSLSSFGHVLNVGWDSHSNRVDHCLFLNSKSMSLARAPTRTPSRATHTGSASATASTTISSATSTASGATGRRPSRSGKARPPALPAALIAYNVFENASGDSEIISLKSSGNTVRHNLFVDCDGSLTLRNGNENTVAANVLRATVDGVSVRGERHRIVNNLFVGLKGAAVLLNTGKQGDETYGAVRQCLIAHNTAVACGSGLRTEEPTADATAAYPEANRALHNLFVGSQGTLVRLGHPSHVQLQGNLFWATGKAAAGTTGENVVVADPRLGGDWLPVIPGPGSPALDAAAPLPDVADDFWGVPRPQAHRADLGGHRAGHGSALIRLPEFAPAAAGGRARNSPRRTAGRLAARR